MKRAILISTVAALTLTAGAGAAFAWGKEHRMGGFDGPRGQMFTFEEVDADKDGKITEAEIAAHFKAKFDAADADKDGSLSAEEMAAQMQAKMAERMTNRAKHMIVDRDGNDDGKLSYEEMQPKNKGMMLQRLDKDGDGAISTEEFAQMQDRMEQRGFGPGKGDHNGRMMRDGDHDGRMMRHGDHDGRGMGMGKGMGGNGDCPMQPKQ